MPEKYLWVQFSHAEIRIGDSVLRPKGRGSLSFVRTANGFIAATVTAFVRDAGRGLGSSAEIEWGRRVAADLDRPVDTVRGWLRRFRDQSELLRGVDILANAVKVTLGPKGRNVVLDKSFGAPRITKDGVTVAKEIELEDKFENMGAQMVREVASKSADAAGDGADLDELSSRERHGTALEQCRCHGR